MLLVRGMARAAVMAGTAASVSHRVSRRQAGRWSEQVGASDEERGSQGAAAQPDTLAQLKQLGELKASGTLTAAEFEAWKAKILAG